MYPLLIILLVLLAYFPSLKSGYAIDDEDVKNVARPEPKNKWQKFWWQFNGYKYFDPQPEHAINLFFHLANCLLIYYAFGKNDISFLTALLFAVNPAGTQGSVWLSGRGYCWTTTIILMMWWLSPLFYLLTPLVALNGILAPLLYLKTSWWWVGLIPIVVFILKFIPLTSHALKARLEQTVGKGSSISPVKILIALKTLGYYTCLAILPIRLGIYHKYLYTYSLSVEDNKLWERTDKFFWIGLAVFLTLLIGYFFNYNQTIFGLFWFFIFIAPFLNLMSLGQPIAERYCYLALIGIMYSLSNLIMLIPDYSTKLVVITAYFIYLFTRLQFHIPAYKNIEACVDYNIMNFPNMHAVWLWKGQLDRKNGSYFTALEAWFKGWRLRKTDFRLNNNIAVMLTELGFLNDAEEFLKNAEQTIIPEQKDIAMKYITEQRKIIANERQRLRNQEIGNRAIPKRRF